ncbi:MAG: hypothetical protein HC898_05875 [Phycisphaerales bacterium]|nr:hypothetical protein [Phycisphaerales bacterium]
MINETVWFHYDLTADVLYLRQADARHDPAVGEETVDGLLLLRRESDDRHIGLTIINWWARFGNGALPDSLIQIEAHMQPLAGRFAA